MSLAARALADAGGSYAFAEQLREIQRQTEWESALPARAAGLSWQVQQVVKRGVDILLSALGLLLLSPLFLVVAVLIKLKSPGPVFYEWCVLGRHARPFVGYKFRTMVIDADQLKSQYLERNEMRGPVFKMRNDPRVTPLGRWLRRFSIDELPQLWSVLKGDMSLVGPRPPSAGEFVQFAPWQRAKLAVTPGITCLWQVSGRSEISDLDAWIGLDLEYIGSWNLWRDVVILARTIPAVLRARGAY
jgi:lipopolysaccharide/colanic/teichoic acid biosynthesis glycosyltransferase